MLKKGFTLIELLIVIAIIAILAGLLVTNYVGARDRALDGQKKSNLREIKTALDLYRNYYHTYPPTDIGLYLKACGPSGDQRCPVCSDAEFAAGGSDGCDHIYLNRLPKNTGGQNEFRYYGCSGGDDYRLKINLTNASDESILESQAKCPVACGTTYNNTDYVLCAD